MVYSTIYFYALSSNRLVAQGCDGTPGLAIIRGSYGDLSRLKQGMLRRGLANNNTRFVRVT